MERESCQPKAWSPIGALGLGLFLFLLLAGLVKDGFLFGPLYGDEEFHFPSTVGLIPFSIEKLETFRELSTPTFFIVCSYVLELFGAHVFWCRLIVFLCLLGCAFLYRSIAVSIASRCNAPSAAAHVTWVLFLTFPYFVGTGIYFYTDIPCLFFLLLTLRAYLNGKTGVAILWGTFALHCRQYSAFLPMGLAGYEFWQWWHDRKGSSLVRAGVWFLPIFSVLPYGYMWGGLMPVRPQHPLIAKMPLMKPWHVTYLLAACGIYLSPLALAVGWRHWSWGKVSWIAVGMSFFCAFLPRPNLYYELIHSDMKTLGLLDIALTKYFGWTGKMPVLGIGMTLAAILHYELLLKSREAEGMAFKWIVVAFWGLNFLSLLAWEKYLLQILPPLYFLAILHPEFCRLCSRSSRVGTLKHAED